MVVYCVPDGISDATHVVVFVFSFNSSVSYKVIVNCNRVHVIHHSKTMFLEYSQILFIVRRRMERIGLSLKQLLGRCRMLSLTTSLVVIYNYIYKSDL